MLNESLKIRILSLFFRTGGMIISVRDCLWRCSDLKLYKYQMASLMLNTFWSSDCSFFFFSVPRFMSSQATRDHRSELQLQPTPQLQQSFNPLWRTRDQTCVLAPQRHCQSCCATAGTPSFFFFLNAF